MAEVQTAHLLEALEAAKRRNEETAATVQDRDGEIESLKADMADQAREFEERLLTTEKLAIAGKIAELEAAYKARKERLEAETAELKGALDNDYQTMRAELARDVEIKAKQAAKENETLKGHVEKMRKDVYEANVKAEGFFADMMERKREHQDETDLLRQIELGSECLREDDEERKGNGTDKRSPQDPAKCSSAIGIRFLSITRGEKSQSDNNEDCKVQMEPLIQSLKGVEHLGRSICHGGKMEQRQNRRKHHAGPDRCR